MMPGTGFEAALHTVALPSLTVVTLLSRMQVSIPPNLLTRQVLYPMS